MRFLRSWGAVALVVQTQGTLVSIVQSPRSDADRTMASASTRPWLDLIYAMTPSWRANTIEDATSAQSVPHRFAVSIMTNENIPRDPAAVDCSVEMLLRSHLPNSLVMQHFNLSPATLKCVLPGLQILRSGILSSCTPRCRCRCFSNTPQPPKLLSHPKRLRKRPPNKKQKNRRLPGLEPGTSRI